ncbi:cytochrome C oxidase subunit IV family protein [Ruegeria meonggei]|uniref:Prokaryotic Cytochrome C oxidase subunit IV n=1 Tax=Ruegeria meonggei TaxID=1446476 RepID=A0A1X6ZK29_9RHOB|nr:cytochrome C oxidase subunit IV family protein [Ruegeria meonggei]SLN53310.1 hypothetical protein RUM8411_02566 [Ruegeria meonggei]
MSDPDITSCRTGSDHLVVAWLGLLILSLASALVTMAPVPPAALGAGILMLALIKTRVILARYLDLAGSPAWLRGFTMVLTCFSAAIFGLYLI